MSDTHHPGEALLDFVDGRMHGPGADAIRAHLADCAACRALLSDLESSRSAVQTLRGTPSEMPVDLLASVTRALDAEATGDRSAAARSRTTEHERFQSAGAVDVGFENEVEKTGTVWGAAWRLGLATAAAVFAFVFISNRITPPDVPALAARDLAAVASASLPLAVQSTEAAALERYFAETDGPRVRVIDLGMMNITLEGGLRHTLRGAPSALYSYRTPSGPRLVCQMFAGRLGDLPPPESVREQNGFRFQIYTRGAVTLVFWQEGDLVCVLASELPAAEVVALAAAKAMAPA